MADTLHYTRNPNWVAPRGKTSTPADVITYRQYDPADMSAYQRVLITGDRHWDTDQHYRIVGSRMRQIPKPCVVVVGDAPGVDKIAWDFTASLDLFVTRFFAQWTLHGKKAGPIRNQAMLNEDPYIVIAFHDDLERSKGTKDCVIQALKRGIPVELHGTDPTGHAAMARAELISTWARKFMPRRQPGLFDAMQDVSKTRG